LSVFAIFVAQLVLGLAIYRDYGFSFDEGAQRVMGAVTVKYVAERVAPSLVTPFVASLGSLDGFVDRDYGVAFEAPAVALEALLRLTDKRDIFLFRHLLTFLACLAGTWALYSLAFQRFGSRALGLLAVAFLVLSPRQFAESFYNSKDMVFMAAFTVALYSMVALTLRPCPVVALLHGLASAFAMDVRIVAIVIPIMTIVLLAIRGLKREAAWRAVLVALGLYLVAAAVLVVAMWPWLWADPSGRFLEALAAMSRFVRWDGPLLYLGGVVRSTSLPWHYAPVWIAVTTPPLYLLLFAAGAAAVAWRLWSARWRLWRSDGELQDLIFLAVAVAPVVGVIALHSVLYDGWRHLYFIYPCLVLVAVRGWQALWDATWLERLRRPALAAVTVASFAATAWWMVRAHPYQNVYFNSLAGSYLRERFELDYWGLGTREGLEYVLRHDSGDPVYVKAGSFLTLDTSAYLLPARERERLRFITDDSHPHYLFTNYRMVDPASDARYREQYELVHEITAAGLPILSIFKSKR
jgi:hypothetical protein